MSKCPIREVRGRLYEFDIKVREALNKQGSYYVTAIGGGVTFDGVIESRFDSARKISDCHWLVDF